MEMSALPVYVQHLQRYSQDMATCAATHTEPGYGNVRGNAHRTRIWQRARQRTQNQNMATCAATHTEPEYGNVRGNAHRTRIWQRARQRTQNHSMATCAATHTTCSQVIAHQANCFTLYRAGGAVSHHIPADSGHVRSGQ